MIEVRGIEATESPPRGADWVLVEITSAGNFVANGVVAHANARGATFFTPPPFESLEAALRASEAWASENCVTAIYVRSSSDGGH